MQQVAQRYREGDSVAELADEFDCHHSTVSRHLKQQGITVSNKGHRPPGAGKASPADVRRRNARQADRYRAGHHA
ncbi:helix-turn-helix domain-containing protein [Schaalia cardiffensis]|uniref:helix-turn-helix domain-containing protein n=1 Tax=Schaalia cardiffensis TaxID=181487 RepID=UPI003C6EEB2E